MNGLRSGPPRRRWRWRVLRHRWRLLRFWVVEHRGPHPRSAEASHLLYIGARDCGKTPLLVLGYHRAKPSERALELTWYPARPEPRAAPRALLDLRPRLRLRMMRLRLRARVVFWPGREWRLVVAVNLEPRDW